MPAGTNTREPINKEIKEKIEQKSSTYNSAFQTGVNKVNDYAKDSTKVVEDTAGMKNTWQEYVEFVQEIKQEIDAKRKAANGREDKRLLDQSEKDVKLIGETVVAKQFKAAPEKVESIRKSNTRVSGLIDDAIGDKDTGVALAQEYDDKAAVYKTEGEKYPDPLLLTKADESFDEMEDKMKLIDHKISSRFSKSNDVSEDIAKSYTDSQGKKDIMKKAKKDYEEKKKARKDGAGELLEYKKGNEEFKEKAEGLFSKLDEGMGIISDFGEDQVEVNGKSLLTSKKQRQYDQYSANLDQVMKNRTEVTKLHQKIASGKMKVSSQVLDKYSRQKTEEKVGNYMKDAAGMGKKYSSMKQNMDDFNKNGKKEDVTRFFEQLYGRLTTNIATYKSERHKIGLEKDATDGKGLVMDVEDDYDALMTVMGKVFAVAGQSSRTAPAEASEGLVSKAYKIAAEYDSFKKVRDVNQLTYKKIKKYVGKRPDRKMIMRLIRKVKLLEEAGGSPVGSSYEGKVNSFLKWIDSVEEAPGKKVGKIANKMGIHEEGDREIASDITSFTAEGMLEQPNEAFDLAKENLTRVHGIKEENINTPEGVEKYGQALSIVGIVTSGYSAFKDLLSAFRDISGGTDAREKLKIVMNLADDTAEILDNVGSLLDNDIIGTIKSAIVIVHRIIDFIRSTMSRVSVSKRKDALRETMKQHATEYEMETEDTKARAKKSGYDKRGWGVITSHFRSEPTTSAKAYISRAKGERDYRKFKKDQAAAGRTDVTGEMEDGEAVTASMHSRMHALRAAHGGEEGEKLEGDDKKEYALLKRIEVTHGYDILKEAEVRMKNKQHDDVYDIITEGWSIASTFIKATASPAAIAAFVADVMVKVLEFGKSVGSMYNKAIRDASGSMYSTQNKQKRRSKMAEDIYDRMVVASGSLNAAGEFDLNEHEDWEVKEAAEHIESVDFILSKGLDAYVSHIIAATSKDDMIEQMSSAFSVEGN